MAYDFDFRFDVQGDVEAQAALKKTGDAYDKAGDEALGAAADFDKAAKKGTAAAKELGAAAQEGGTGIGDLSGQMGDALGPAQDMFKVTDRLTGILGAATGAVALVAGGVALATAAYDAYTGSAEAAAVAAANTTALLEEQAGALDAVTARIEAAQEALGAYATTQDLLAAGAREDADLKKEQADAVAKLTVLRKQEAAILNQITFNQEQVAKAGGLVTDQLDDYGNTVRRINKDAVEFDTRVSELRVALSDLQFSLSTATIKAEFFTGALRAATAPAVGLTGSLDLLSTSLDATLGKFGRWGGIIEDFYTAPTKAATNATRELISAQSQREDAAVAAGLAEFERLNNELEADRQSRQIEADRVKDDQGRQLDAIKALDAEREEASRKEQARIAAEIELQKQRWDYAVAYTDALDVVAGASELAGFSAVTAQRLVLVADGVEAGVKASKETAASIASFANGNVWGGAQHAIAAASYTVAAGKAAQGLSELGGAPSGSGGSGSASPAVTAGAPADTGSSAGSGGGSGDVVVNIGGNGGFIFGSADQVGDAVADAVAGAWGREGSPRYTDARKGRSPSDFRS